MRHTVVFDRGTAPPRALPFIKIEGGALDPMTVRCGNTLQTSQLVETRRGGYQLWQLTGPFLQWVPGEVVSFEVEAYRVPCVVTFGEEAVHLL